MAEKDAKKESNKKAAARPADTEGHVAIRSRGVQQKAPVAAKDGNKR